MRLQRALEDVEKHKAAADRERRAARDGVDEHRKEREGLEQKIRRLERQKLEVLAAFKKQIKLIDILKRQKVHMEAARILAFTEDEFMRVVNWDDAATPAAPDKSAKPAGARAAPPRAPARRAVGAGA